MDNSQVFVIEALSAAKRALTALSGGQVVQADNLIAGAMALELIAIRGDLAALRFTCLHIAMRGLRSLAMQHDMAANDGGQLVAEGFAAMLDAPLSQAVRAN